MAVLSGIEGQAHLDVIKEPPSWSGYFLSESEPDPRDMNLFSSAGPQSNTVYEGPVFLNGQYHLALGRVKILRVNLKYPGGKLRVDFKGLETLKLTRLLPGPPEDYLP